MMGWAGARVAERLRRRPRFAGAASLGPDTPACAVHRTRPLFGADGRSVGAPSLQSSSSSAPTHAHAHASRPLRPVARFADTLARAKMLRQGTVVRALAALLLLLLALAASAKATVSHSESPSVASGAAGTVGDIWTNCGTPTWAPMLRAIPLRSGRYGARAQAPIPIS